MPGIVRKGDLCSGHECWPPRMGISASPDVLVNNKPVERNGDVLATHCCPGKDCHSGVYIGNHTVIVNSRSIQVKGDPISCGSICSICSSDTSVE